MTEINIRMLDDGARWVEKSKTALKRQLTLYVIMCVQMVLGAVLSFGTC
jgi:uncharacterized membrane protein YoaK (UPF0700 family)